MSKKRRFRLPREWDDNHHICFPRTLWQKGVGIMLRQYWYCIVSIPRETLHQEIHHEVSDIPVPRNSSIMNVLEALNRLAEQGAIHKEDGIERRLQILIALFDCIEPKTTKALKKQLQVVERFYQSP